MLLLQLLRSLQVSLTNISSTSWSDVKSYLRYLSRDTYPAMNVLYAGDILETKEILTNITMLTALTIKEKSMAEIASVLDVSM